jgi:hypothetical protein
VAHQLLNLVEIDTSLCQSCREGMAQIVKPAFGNLCILDSDIECPQNVSTVKRITRFAVKNEIRFDRPHLVSCS